MGPTHSEALQYPVPNPLEWGSWTSSTVSRAQSSTCPAFLMGFSERKPLSYHALQAVEACTWRGESLILELPSAAGLSPMPRLWTQGWFLCFHGHPPPLWPEKVWGKPLHSPTGVIKGPGPQQPPHSFLTSHESPCTPPPSCPVAACLWLLSSSRLFCSC